MYKYWNFLASRQYDPRYAKKYLRAYADNEGPDQLARPRSLIRLSHPLSVNKTIVHYKIISMGSKCPYYTLRMRWMILNVHCAHARRHIFTWCGQYKAATYSATQNLHYVHVSSDQDWWNFMKYFHYFKCFYVKCTLLVMFAASDKPVLFCFVLTKVICTFFSDYSTKSYDMGDY